MDELTIARAIHIVCVVMWIGGVLFVTTVGLPWVKSLDDPAKGVETFHRIEKAFIGQARITTLITGLSGFTMLYFLDGWDRYLDSAYWWLYAMTILWTLFMLVMYILEPFVLPKIMAKKVQGNPAVALKLVHRVHWVLSLLSLVTVFAAVVGVHGG